MWKEQGTTLIMLVISLLEKVCVDFCPPTLAFQSEPPAKSFSTSGYRVIEKLCCCSLALGINRASGCLGSDSGEPWSKVSSATCRLA